MATGIMGTLEMARSAGTGGTPNQFLKDPKQQVPLFRQTGITQKPPVRNQPDSGAPRTLAATTAAPAVDPYAKYGGQGSYDRLMSGFDTQKSNIFSTSKEAAQNAGISRKSSILDFIEGLQSGQRGIDERGVQNELAKKQGSASIMDTVGRGMRSGATMLAGRNALDSSAAEQVGQAYGDIGRRELGKVGNAYELENRNIDMSQADFETQRQSGMRKFDEGKAQTVNSIVTEARNSLAALDASMVEADVPTRVAIEQEKNRIKQDALQILSQFDQQLAQGAGGVKATGLDERRRTAAGLATAGVAAENPFDVTTEAPAEFAGTGPYATELPFFTLNRTRRQEV
jgi:hypothetical protein